MQEYVKISIILSIYGIFKEFRPSEPYLVPIMTSSPLNFTEAQLTEEVFPVNTYTTAVLLVFIFLVTDFLRYKKVIIAQAVAAIITYLMIIFGRTIFVMQIMQVVYSMFSAADVAYFTYIYAKVDLIHYQEVTSYTRSAYLVGKSLSGIASQVIVYFNLLGYEALLWITVGSEVLALLWTFVIPSVDSSIYFHRKTSPVIGGNGNQKSKFKTVVGFLKTDLVAGFTNPYVLKWAVWWALATCNYYLVTSYAQILWQRVMLDSNNDSVQYNGAVETTYTLLGAVGSMVMGRVRVDWRRYGEALLAIGSLLMCGLLYLMSSTMSVAVAYICYVLCTTTYQIIITIANSEVARNINQDSFGLIFGVTNFVVYLLESLYTYIVLQLLQLGPRAQFQVYSVYFGVLGLCVLIAVMGRILKKKLC